MRRHPLVNFLLIGVLAAAVAVACSDAVGPEQATSVAPPQTQTPPAQPAATPPDDRVYLNSGDRSILVGDTIPMSGYLYRGRGEEADTLVWESNDTSTASIELVGKNAIRIRALRTGAVTISARTRSGLAAHANLEVYARSSAPSPIVVDEFSVGEYTGFNNGQFYYLPKLVLHDTSSLGSARIVGIRVEVPGISQSIDCWANHAGGRVAWTVFPDIGDMNAMMLTQRDRRSIPRADAVARVTAILGSGQGVSMVLTGNVDTGPVATSWHEAPDEGLRCQLRED